MVIAGGEGHCMGSPRETVFVWAFSAGLDLQAVIPIIVETIKNSNKMRVIFIFAS
jgi:hypothetical protein